MNFYADKLVISRKQSHLSGEKIAKAINICRTTYWKWEKGHSTPNRKQVKLLAKILEIPVSDISNLENLENYNSEDTSELSNNVDSWLSFMNTEENKNFRSVITKTFKDTIKLSDKLNEAGIIIRALLAGLNSIFYIKNTDLNYITASSSFLKNLSLKEGYKVYGKIDEDFFSKKEAKENNTKDEKVLITKESIVEEGYIPGSRKKKWGIISRMPVFDIHNNTKGVITNITDITNRKRIEFNNELLRKCIENIPAGVAISEYNSDRFTFLNKAFENITGYSLDKVYKEGKQFVANHCFIPRNKEKTEEYRKNWNSRPETNEYKIICKDKNEKWIEDKRALLISYMNKKYSVSVFNDITGRKEQEINEDLLDIYFKESLVGIIIFDNETNLPIYFNKALENIYEPKESTEVLYKMDRANTIEKRFHPEYKARELGYIKNKNWPDKREIKIITPSNKIKWIEVIHINKNVWSKNCSISVVSDITNRKKNTEITKILKKHRIDKKIIKEIENII